MTSAPCSSRSCHAISEIVVTVLRALVHERAVDGKIDLADLDRLLGFIQRGSLPLDQAFLAQEDKCRKAHSRPKGNVGARSNPFQRLVVRPFESLLMGEDPILPRPYLAAYFDFVRFALIERIDGYERDCRAIIQALLVIHGNNLTWDHFYSDPRTLKVLNASLRGIVQTLVSPEGGKAWAKFMFRPAGDLPPPGVPQVDQVRDALIATFRGLSAEG